MIILRTFTLVVDRQNVAIFRWGGQVVQVQDLICDCANYFVTVIEASSARARSIQNGNLQLTEAGLYVTIQVGRQVPLESCG